MTNKRKKKEHLVDNVGGKKILYYGFSGGRTSAILARFLQFHKTFSETYHIIYGFANTSKEKEETLIFIKRCEDEWGIKINWLEAVINPGYRVATTHKVVSYETACRDGSIFEDMLKKYPLPNTAGASNCTRELKDRVRESFMYSLGYRDYYTAYGIRYDEQHRVSVNAQQNRIIYPAIDTVRLTEPIVRSIWDKQPFDLQLKDYEGNCTKCFKKSIQKLVSLMVEDILSADLEDINWWIYIEEKYSSEKSPRFNLREHVTVRQLYEMALEITSGIRNFIHIEDKHEKRKWLDDRIIQVGTEHGITKEMMQHSTDCFCKSN